MNDLQQDFLSSIFQHAIFFDTSISLFSKPSSDKALLTTFDIRAGVEFIFVAKLALAGLLKFKEASPCVGSKKYTTDGRRA